MLKFLKSSSGEGLAKRWETVFSGIIPLVVALSAWFGWGLVEADLTELSGQIIVILSSGVAIWKAIDHINGWALRNFRKQNKLGAYSLDIYKGDMGEKGE